MVYDSGSAKVSFFSRFFRELRCFVNVCSFRRSQPVTTASCSKQIRRNGNGKGHLSERQKFRRIRIAKEPGSGAVTATLSEDCTSPGFAVGINFWEPQRLPLQVVGSGEGARGLRSLSQLVVARALFLTLWPAHHSGCA